MMPKPKFSIITIAINQLQLTVNCIKSVMEHTEDYEHIIIDNGSNDGTTGYLRELAEKHDHIKLIRNDHKANFSENNNVGLSVAEGQYIIFLNNDTIVSPNWAKTMHSHFINCPMKHIGAVGPMGTNSGGRQRMSECDPVEWYRKNQGRWSHAGRLFGWCLMVPKKILDEVGGFDGQFDNSYDDNDLCLRIQLAGHKLVIAVDTFIRHVGQGTLRNFLDMDGYISNGYENRTKFYNKYNDTKRRRLVAVYRLGNVDKYIRQSLIQTSKFADQILVHLCRSSDDTENILREFPKVTNVWKYDGVFQEDYERNFLLQRALELHEKGEADWCISIDGDEIYEDKFIDQIQTMMNPRNPETFAYSMNWRTIWREEEGKEFYRTDSTFGQFVNYRFFRLMPNQEIISSHPEGHHCGSSPVFAPENIQWTNIRVKHLGYDSPEQRREKFNFYQKNDNFKNSRDIGNNDYSHLVDRNVKLELYDEDNSITCCMMVKNEEQHIEECLLNVENLVDEYVIADTGSTDKTIQLIKDFASRTPKKFIFLEIPWEDNYSTIRNKLMMQASSKWILHMDADERFMMQDLPRLWALSEQSEMDICIFHVLNYLEEQREVGQLPKYASTESARLFRNHPEFFYSGIVHETLDDCLGTIGNRMNIKGCRVEFPLHHFGYLKKKNRVQQKMNYYEDLNARQIEITDDTDPRPHFNLAMHFAGDGVDSKAVLHLQKAVDIQPTFWHARQQLAAINLKSAKMHLEQVHGVIAQAHPFRAKAKEIIEYIDTNSFGCQKVV